MTTTTSPAPTSVAEAMGTLTEAEVAKIDDSLTRESVEAMRKLSHGILSAYLGKEAKDKAVASMLTEAGVTIETPAKINEEALKVMALHETKKTKEREFREAVSAVEQERATAHQLVSKQSHKIVSELGSTSSDLSRFGIKSLGKGGRRGKKEDAKGDTEDNKDDKGGQGEDEKAKGEKK